MIQRHISFVETVFFAEESTSRSGYIENQFLLVICQPMYSFLGNSYELDKCVSVAMLGFQSVDDIAWANQFMYKEGESKKNFYSGDHSGLFEYILEQFCPPTGTVLDMSCDPEGIMQLSYAFKCC